MKKTKADLILHPIRMRIIQQLSAGEMTAQMVSAALPDIPQATLYRHIKALAEGKLIQVVGERQVHSNMEKIYALATQGGTLTPADLAGLSKDDHLRAFTAFATGLLADFGQALDQTDDLATFLAGFRANRGTLFMTEAEAQAVQAGLRSLLGPYLQQGDNPERVPYFFSVTLFQGSKPPEG